MSKDERIKGLLRALNAVCDALEGRTAQPWAMSAWIEADHAVRDYGEPLDAQRGLFGLGYEADDEVEARA